MSGQDCLKAKPVYLQSLQVFRGLAALGVVLYHADLFSERQLGRSFCGDFFVLGELGVDFFFVLSGFIIAMIHWKDIGDTSTANRYLRRRFFRVYPLLFVMTTLKIGIMVARGGEGLDSTRVVASYLLFPLDGTDPIITAAWTLTHEALFYGVFLLVIMLGRIGAWILLGGWTIALLAIHGSGIELHGLMGFVFDNHNIEFLIGVGIFLWLDRGGVNVKTVWPAVVAAVIAFVVGATLFEPETGKAQVLGVRLFVGAGFGLLIAIASYLEKEKIWKRTPFALRWLGDASYSIYLGHSFVLLMILTVCKNRIGDSLVHSHVLVGGAVVAALIGTGLLWTLVEKPMLTFSKRWTK